MKDKRGPNDLEVVIKKLQLQNRFSNEQLEFLTNIVKLYRTGKCLESAKNNSLIQNYFPNGSYRDIKGLCKISNISEIEEQGWSLNPGRYVGIVPEKDDGIDFKDKLLELRTDLKKINQNTKELELRIENDLDALLK